MYVLLFLYSLSFASEPLLTPKPWNFKTLQFLPIQSGGRIKPFDTYAQELVTAITGRSSFEKFQPIDLLFSWIAYPQEWNEKPIFLVPYDVQTHLELPGAEKKKRFSQATLLKNEALIHASHKITLPDAPLSALDKKIKTLIEQVQLFQGVISGRAWPIIPTSTQWLHLNDTQETEKSVVYEFWMLLKQYQTNNPVGFENNSNRLIGSVQFLVPSFYKIKNALLAEVFLNHLRPFFYAWIFYFLACLFFSGQHFSFKNRRILKKKCAFLLRHRDFFSYPWDRTKMLYCAKTPCH